SDKVGNDKIYEKEVKIDNQPPEIDFKEELYNEATITVNDGSRTKTIELSPGIDTYPVEFSGTSGSASLDISMASDSATGSAVIDSLTLKADDGTIIEEISTQGDWDEGSYQGLSTDRNANSGNLALGKQDGSSGDRLVGFWRFDQDVSGSGGTVQDYSGEGNSATLYNGSEIVSKGIAETSAVNLNGKNQSIEVSRSSDLNTSSLTFSTWFKLDRNLTCSSGNNWRSFAYKGSSSSGADKGWDIVLEESGAVAFDVNGTRWWPHRTDNFHGEQLGYPINDWRHYTFTYEESTGKMAFYRDGELIDYNYKEPGPIEHSEDTLKIGGATDEGCPNGSGYVPGSYDEVKVYNEAMSSSEIRNMYEK
ncbi:MAG: hypothetical protein BRC26_02820, partial [Nanohaloarchaea archaeon QH_8_44_6]